MSTAQIDHEPRYRRRLLGHGMQGGNFYGYTIECACGWTYKTNENKREAVKDFNAHKREARAALAGPAKPPRAAPSASPSLVEGERQELLGKEEADAELRGWLAGRKEARAAVAMLISAGSFEELDGLSKAHAVIRDLVPPAALAEQQPRAAPPISLEEQAQPDAQDLTEEEIARLEWAVRHAVQPSVIELVPRLIANEKRRRGIK